MISTSIINQIQAIYNRENANCRTRDKKCNIEIEARLGHFINGKWLNGIRQSEYNNLKLLFEKELSADNSYSIDEINEQIRMSKDENGHISWIRKERIWQSFLKDYPIKISLSRELDIEKVDNFQAKVIRKKYRTSFYLFSHAMRLDLTKVEEEIIERQSLTYRFELELEILDIQRLNKLDPALNIILKKHYQTFELYSQEEKENIIEHVNTLLAGWYKHPYDRQRNRNVLDDHLLVQVRSLKLRDLVFGGLIGNNKTSYVVSHKVDGIRYLLVFHTSGIWLINAPHNVIKISSDNVVELNGTILDGEYIPVERRKATAPESLVWYVVFDCLASTKLRNASQSGDNYIQKLPLINRLGYCQSIADRYKNSVIFLTTKIYRQLVSADQMFEIVRQFIAEKDILPYYQDGLIFTPSDLMYNPHSERLKLDDRVLTHYADVCKWKPPSELSIDFAIRYNQSKNIELYSLPFHSQGKLVLFAGSNDFPFNPTLVDSTHPLTKNIENNTIVEYKWNSEREKFIPSRIRLDKIKPNRLDFATTIWQDINNPITTECIQGNTFTLMRKYHNRIKRQLYSSINGENLTLLDIGSGRGGDVTKWSKFSKVIAVEPNAEHIVELKKRIALAKMEEKVKIVQAGGEDSEIIAQEVNEFIGHRVSVISFMLSLSFFWSSDEMLDKLAKTILSTLNENGTIIFLTIDGNIVNQIFQPAFKNAIPIRSLNLGPATLTYNNDQSVPKLLINIPDSIVSNQEEWLVNLDDLIIRLNPYFQLTTIKRADKERFLSSFENRLSLMYSYGIFNN